MIALFYNVLLSHLFSYNNFQNRNKMCGGGDAVLLSSLISFNYELESSLSI